MTARRTAFLLSIGLHCLISLNLLNRKHVGLDVSESKTQLFTGKVKPRLKTAHVDLVLAPEHLDPVAVPRKRNSRAHPLPDQVSNCVNGAYYEGVGLSSWISESGLDVVTEVYEGYPAHGAGILVGDVIVASSGALTGPRGSTVEVIVRRGGSDSSITLTRERICLF